MDKEFKSIDFALDTDMEGKVEAVFSVFNNVDSDGDVVLPNSLKSFKGLEGEVPMVWSHKWENPIGKGRIVQDDDKATFKGEFIMSSESGKEAYEIVKAMGDLQQWSFGFQVDDAEQGTFQKDGQSEEVRYIKSATVFEVSPVLVGANQSTYTVAVKEQKEKDVESGLRFTDEAKSVLNTIDSFIDRAKELTSLRLEKGKMLSKSAQDSLMQIQDRIQEVYNDIDNILGLGAENEEAKQPSDELDSLWLNTQEVLAQSQGITYEGEKNE